MGMYKRKTRFGDRWYYRGQYKGQKYCSQVIYLTKKEAKKAEGGKIDEIHKRITNPTVDMSIKDLMDARLDEIQAKKSLAYYKDTKRYFKTALEFWGRARMVSELTKIDVNALLLRESKRLKAKKRQNYSVNALIRALLALFNFGLRVYELEKNPVRFISKYSIDVKLKYIPTNAEIIAVQGKFNPIQAFLFDFVDQTACRISEALRFEGKDIDGTLITLWTRKAKNSNLTPRRIPTPDCLKDYKGKGRVFAEWNEHPGFLEKAVKDLEQPKWNWHCLRHRRASIWANDGMTTIELMQRLGHANIEITTKYLHLLGFTSR